MILRLSVILCCLLGLFGCISTAYIEQDYVFDSLPAINSVQVCSMPFVSKTQVDNLAQLYCSRYGKRPGDKLKVYFGSCALLYPVGYIYQCK